MFLLFINLLLLWFFEHDVAHLLLLNYFLLELCLLFAFNFKLFLGLVDHLPIILLFFNQSLLADFVPELHLLVENFTHLFDSSFICHLLFLHLLLVESLSEPLNLTPFVFADIRWHVFYLNYFCFTWDPPQFLRGKTRISCSSERRASLSIRSMASKIAIAVKIRV